MSVAVYANGMSIACKVASGKTIAAMPDVCLSPPAPPVPPIPYPNTAAASDTDSGSKTVQIGGEEVMLKDKSTFKTSTGNEAATKSFGMGVVTHQITGKAAFVAWSMDVKFEGENVPRHMDIMGHNEGSIPPNTPTWPYIDHLSKSEQERLCGDEMEAVKNECKNAESNDHQDTDCPPIYASATKNAGYRNNPCVKAKRCMLVPYKRQDNKKGGCCPGQTAHHIVPKHHFANFPGYEEGEAPCVCAEGHSWHRNDESPFNKRDKTHPDMHDLQDASEREAINVIADLIDAGEDVGNRTPDNAMNFAEARESGIAAHQEVFSDCDPPCSKECLEAQINAYHRQGSVAVRNGSLLHTKPTGVAE